MQLEQEIFLTVVMHLTGIADVELEPFEVNIDEREFRTCFTLWSYDSGDRFIGPDGTISMVEFENLLLEATLAEIEVSLYSDRSSGLSVFQIN